MSRFPKTNASWISIVGANTNGEVYPINPTNRASDRASAQLHRQFFSNRQHFSHPLRAEILESGAEVHQTAFSGFAGSQNTAARDLATKGVEYQTQALTLTKCESLNSTIRNLNADSIEYQVIAPAQELAQEPIQEPMLTEPDAKFSAVGDSALNIIEHKAVEQMQEPAQEPTSTKCIQCLEKGRSCNGTNAKRSCHACIERKETCSFRPYLCKFCKKYFAREIDRKGHITKFHKSNTRIQDRLILEDSRQSTSSSDASRPSKRIRKDTKVQSSPKDTGVQATQVRSIHQQLQTESPQIMATQQDQTAVSLQIGSARDNCNGSSSQIIQQEHAHGLYQPDSPAYYPTGGVPPELPHELRNTTSLSPPHQGSLVEHMLAQNLAQDGILQQMQPVQLIETSVHSQSAQFTSPSPTSPVINTHMLKQYQDSILQQLSPVQPRDSPSSENIRKSSQSQKHPVEHTPAQNIVQGATLQQNSLIQPRESSTHSKRAPIHTPYRTSPVQDSPHQHQVQNNTGQRLSSVEPGERSNLLRNSDHDIYLQFPNRVMKDNHVENRLGAIREEIKLYEEFMRGKIKDYTDAEVEEKLKGLEKFKPFVCIEEVEKEEAVPFASQPSRILILWRNMLAVPPTARLRDELVRFDLEGLQLPVVICSSLAYITLHVIFNDPDRLRVAERRAGFESVKQLHGTKYAAESIKHDQLFIDENRSVARELKKPARDHAEHFYEILYRLTHLHPENPTNNMKEDHINQLADIALKSLRLSRELQARRTEDYSYFWPCPGELFNRNDHIDAEDDQVRSQSGRIIRWTLMFGVTASRDGQPPKVYAKAIVMTMEA